MTYITEAGTDFHGRNEVTLDVRRFAADLAKELGGKLVPVKADDMNHKNRAEITLGNDVLSFNVPYYVSREKMRLTFHIGATDVKHEERNFYDKAHKTADANVNPDRPIALIARDVKRRVIEASQEALRLQREHAEMLQACPGQSR